MQKEKNAIVLKTNAFSAVLLEILNIIQACKIFPFSIMLMVGSVCQLARKGRTKYVLYKTIVHVPFSHALHMLLFAERERSSDVCHLLTHNH